MSKVRTLLDGRWTIPAISGFLIASAFVVQRLIDTQSAADIAMVTAAVVAGAPIAIKAVNALMARIVGIDLLVAVAAIGAVIIGEYWEAAAVTFLFAIGHALELATLNRTRSALAELVAVAPDVAVVMRDGVQIEVPASQVIIGEIVLVKNGAKVPVDGQVHAGTGGLDEASITANPSRSRKPSATRSSPAPSPRGACRSGRPVWGLTPRSRGSFTVSRKHRTPRPRLNSSWTGSLPGTPPSS